MIVAAPDPAISVVRRLLMERLGPGRLPRISPPTHHPTTGFSVRSIVTGSRVSRPSNLLVMSVAVRTRIRPRGKSSRALAAKNVESGPAHLTWTRGSRDIKSGFVRKWISPQLIRNEKIGDVKSLEE